MASIRKPAVAGMFYPADPDELGAAVRSHLRRVDAQAEAAPKALIVPHAGYVYSGDVAASAYGRLGPHRDRYRRVVLLGPCHHVAVGGLASSSAQAFRTPLGDVPVDRQALARLSSAAVRTFDATHEFEHSLEVHLPFLQSVLNAFSIVPLVVGDASPEVVAEVIEQLWGGPETLIVVSSDLSHYLSYEDAQRTDGVTRRAIESLDAGVVDHAHACGATPVAGLVIAAKRRGMAVRTLDLRNSGDTAGSKDRVVGYGAWMFLENEAA